MCKMNKWQNLPRDLWFLKWKAPGASSSLYVSYDGQHSLTSIERPSYLRSDFVNVWRHARLEVKYVIICTSISLPADVRWGSVVASVGEKWMRDNNRTPTDVCGEARISYNYIYLSNTWRFTFETDAVHLRSGTEVAPNSTLLCVNKRPARYGSVWF